MIASLKGILRFKAPGQVTVEVNGVGYRVFIPLTTFYELADEGATVALNIYTAVREDAIHLFGFHTAEEKQVFEMLLSVNGIGPKLAVNLLSGISPSEFARTVFTEDSHALTKIPGVGKKTAERMILELRDKVIRLDGAAEERKKHPSIPGEVREDALSALVNLGYRKSVAKTAVDRVLDSAGDGLALEEILKRALKELS